VHMLLSDMMSRQSTVSTPRWMFMRHSRARRP
jgi:hypothetical protein